MPRSAGRTVVDRAITLWVILTDRDTPLWARALIVGVLGYFIWPFDAVPDTVPVLGYVDDATMLGIVLSQVDRFLTPAMRERVQWLMPEWLRRKTKSNKGDKK
jgi:uncharacterized membrane protein YkvA (DUF1232 family)